MVSPVVVLTVDQRGSRTSPDRIPDMIAGLATVPTRLGFERTAGDEMQGVLDDGAAVADTLARLLRDDAWNIGVGVGVVEEPLPDHARAGRGPAYVHARTAVTTAKSSPWHTRVVGDDPAARALETTIWLWAAVLARRTGRGWEVADLVAEGLSYAEVGGRLGISQSAVSQRAQAAGIVEARRAHELVTRLTTHLLGRETEMTTDNWGALVLVLLGFALLCGLAAWLPAGRRVWAPATLLLLATAMVVAAAPERVAVEGRGLVALLVGLGGAVAVAGGGPLTALVFDLVDRREVPAESLDQAGHVLRGGAWIGALERGAIYATLVAGWPEGLAVVLAVKGLGRYPELRAAEDGVRTGAAERFIIGTFASVLWACAAAAVVAAIR